LATEKEQPKDQNRQKKKKKNLFMEKNPKRRGDWKEHTTKYTEAGEKTPSKKTKKTVLIKGGPDLAMGKMDKEKMPAPKWGGGKKNFQVQYDHPGGEWGISQQTFSNRERRKNVQGWSTNKIDKKEKKSTTAKSGPHGASGQRKDRSGGTFFDKAKGRKRRGKSSAQQKKERKEGTLLTKPEVPTT